MLGLMLILAWECYISVPHWKEAQASADSREIKGWELGGTVWDSHMTAVSSQGQKEEAKGHEEEEQKEEE